MVDAVLDAISALAKEEFVSTHLIERIPFIFSEDWSLYRSWRREFALRLGVDPCDICVVGSAGVGISLNPSKDFRPFSDDSDVDVALISPYHFDVAWRQLRRLRISDTNTHKERRSLEQHQKRLVYWGCIATDQILRFLPFAADWSRAAIEMSSIPPTEGREINFRVIGTTNLCAAIILRTLRAYGKDGNESELPRHDYTHDLVAQ